MSVHTMTTGHVGLNVTDLDRSIRFYRDILGFDLIRESTSGERRYAFLGAGQQVSLTLWQQSTAGAAHDRAGLHHLAFEVASIERVREAEQRLTAFGVHFAYEGVVAQADGAASGGIFFEDPDGIRLEIYAPEGAEGLPTPVPGAPTCGFF